MSPAWPADPFRILLVVDNDEIARGVAAALGPEFAGGLRTCMKLDQLKAQARSHRAQAIVLALESIDAVERIALALQGDGVRPFLLALCDGAGTAVGARLSRDGIVDDYVQHFPVPADPDRLATSIRLASRIAPPSSAMATPLAPAVDAAPAKRRSVVLLVEDDEVLHTLVAAMLESEPVDLVFEADGAAAFERVSAVGPDLVLMDVMLPGGDGVALTERIKSTPDLAAIPVVMLSGEARLDTLVRSMEAGAADFIVKPFTREALIAKLAKYLPA
ncbi:MAG TPA: response regulator [Caldimonas sp.]|nr:response regulator [Caldimonas sp.]